jgi:DNA-binding LacI/PurR family transcriptional regulator
MHDAISAKGYQSLIACSFGQTRSMLEAIKLFEAYKVDGIVLDISEGVVTPEVQRRLKIMQERSSSVVVTGSQHHNLGFDHLYLNNKSAVAKLMGHLITRGHRDFAFVGGFQENLNIKNRLAAFKQSLVDTKLAQHPEWISLGDPVLGNVTQRVHRMLRDGSRPTAVVCTSDMIAMAVIKVALEVGLRVPQDLAVTGFDDVDLASMINPSLTTLRQPLHTMAEDIVELLLHRLEKTRMRTQGKRYEAELVIRGST